jgi:hypothetical protein
MMHALKFFNLYDPEKIHRWTADESIYWRHIPYVSEFYVIVVMVILNDINRVYKGDR